MFWNRRKARDPDRATIEKIVVGYDIALEEIGILTAQLRRDRANPAGAGARPDRAGSDIARLERHRKTIEARKAAVGKRAAPLSEFADEINAIGKDLEEIEKRVQALGEGGAYGCYFTWSVLATEAERLAGGGASS